MKHIFLAFPAGAAGIALILLRLSVALWMVDAAGRISTDDPWPALPFYIAACALVIGFPTRIIAGLSAFGVVIFALVSSSVATFDGVGVLLNAIGLALIGPGAYSLDAAVFGRRTIHLPE